MKFLIDVNFHDVSQTSYARQDLNNSYARSARRESYHRSRDCFFRWTLQHSNTLVPTRPSLPSTVLRVWRRRTFAREVASAAAAVNGLASLDELRSLRSLRR